MFLPCFVNHVLFYIFHLGKLLLTPNTLIVIPVNLNFFLISDNSPLLFWANQIISLINLTNPATTILYHSSLAISFSSVRQYYGLFKLKADCSIRSFSDFCLIMAKCFWSTGSIWPTFDPRTKYCFPLVCRSIS